MAINREFPILEHDSEGKPISDAAGYAIYKSKRKVVKRAIFTYFSEVVEQLERQLKLNQAFRLRTEGHRPRVYEMLDESGEFIYVLPMPLGAPQAARMMEILAANGVEKFMVCGGCGTFDNEKTKDYVLVPTSAVRDEGTSYHYLPPSREIEINPEVLKVIEGTLRAEGVRHVPVKTWTTDASFRSTQNKVDIRKAEGCSVVEMECSAFYSVAKAKRLLCGQLLYAGDHVTQEGWDYRDWHNRTEKRIKLFELAVKCLMNM